MTVPTGLYAMCYGAYTRNFSAMKALLTTTMVLKTRRAGQKVAHKIRASFKDYNQFVSVDFPLCREVLLPTHFAGTRV